MSRNKIMIPVGNKFLIYREIGNVVLAEKDADPYDSIPQILATSAVGCHALAEAFEEMSVRIRELKKKERADESDQ